MKTIGLLFKGLFWLTLLALVGAVLLVLGSLQQTPLVSEGQILNRQDIKRARVLLRQHDPRRQRTDQLRTLVLSDRDLNLLASYSLSRFGKGAARVALSDKLLSVDTTFKVPQNPLGPYLNLSLSVSEANGKAALEQLRVGTFDIPPAIMEWLFPLILSRLIPSKDFEFASDTLREVRLQPKRLTLVYKSHPELVDELRGRLLTGEEQGHYIAAYRQLTRALRHSPTSRLGMSEVLGLMFQQVKASDSGDPVSANRAAIIVLAAHINGRDLGPLLGADTPLSKARRVFATLRGRRDLAKHFIVSAALNVSGGGALSQLLGLHKELSDAQGGSGFSFVDLAADMAGNRFAEVLTGNASEAGRSQGLLAAGLPEDAFMPPIDGLSERMQEAEFKRRYGGTESPAYRKVVSEIERRIQRCALYR